MPRTRNLIPRLCRHKASDRACARVQGRQVSFGKWGSFEAVEAYCRFVAEHTAGTNEPRCTEGRPASPPTLRCPADDGPLWGTGRGRAVPRAAGDIPRAEDLRADRGSASACDGADWPVRKRVPWPRRQTVGRGRDCQETCRERLGRQARASLAAKRSTAGGHLRIVSGVTIVVTRSSILRPRITRAWSQTPRTEKGHSELAGSQLRDLLIAGATMAPMLFACFRAFAITTGCPIYPTTEIHVVQEIAGAVCETPSIRVSPHHAAWRAR